MKPEFRMMNSVPNARFWHWYRDESIVEGTTPSPPPPSPAQKKGFLLPSAEDGEVFSNLSKFKMRLLLASKNSHP